MEGISVEGGIVDSSGVRAVIRARDDGGLGSGGGSRENGQSGPKDDCSVFGLSSWKDGTSTTCDGRAAGGVGLQDLSVGHLEF